MSAHANFKTVSEQHFSCYLDEHRYAWTYEPQIEGKRKKPDFLACRDGFEFLCDTKERSPKAAPPGARHFDPIQTVRRLIDEGRLKFMEFAERLCILVAYNNGDCDTRLDPTCIFGAMLGDPGFTLDFDLESGTCDPYSTQNVFLERGGRMIRHYKPLEPRESPNNLSAVVALTSYRVPNPAFQRASVEEEEIQRQQKGQDLTTHEKLEITYKLLQSMRMTLRETPKVVVCINPFARHPLPDRLFDGPYDERWAIQNGTLQQVFAGAELKPEE
jgi:hypothetical protein